MALPRGAVRWFVVCDCGISWTFSLAFLDIHKPESENEAGKGTMIEKVREETFQLLREWVSVGETGKQVNQEIEILEIYSVNKI